MVEPLDKFLLLLTAVADWRYGFDAAPSRCGHTFNKDALGKTQAFNRAAQVASFLL